MLVNDLTLPVLIDPVRKSGANELMIVSGYATSAMAFAHLDSLIRVHRHELKVRLIVGMCRQDGISLSNHQGFLELTSAFPGRFECSYVMRGTPVHAKTYVWLKSGNPVHAYLGSANYTQTAFGKRQREVMGICDPTLAYNYFNSIAPDTIYCTHNDVAELIQIYSEQNLRKAIVQAHDLGQEEAVEQLDELEVQHSLLGLERVTVSLVSQKTGGTVPERSGLNWGQRPEYNRDPNQAYISLTAPIYRSDFFPPRGVHFTVTTDDNRVLICTRAQDHDKAIHTPQDNSLIGLYFRNRLEVPSGEMVTLEDLERYGRTDVDFYKIDDETYFMDFSVP